MPTVVNKVDGKVQKGFVRNVVSKLNNSNKGDATIRGKKKELVFFDLDKKAGSKVVHQGIMTAENLIGFHLENPEYGILKDIQTGYEIVESKKIGFDKVGVPYNPSAS